MLLRRRVQDSTNSGISAGALDCKSALTRSVDTSSERNECIPLEQPRAKPMHQLHKPAGNYGLGVISMASRSFVVRPSPPISCGVPAAFLPQLPAITCLTCEESRLALALGHLRCSCACPPPPLISDRARHRYVASGLGGLLSTPHFPCGSGECSARHRSNSSTPRK